MPEILEIIALELTKVGLFSAKLAAEPPLSRQFLALGPAAQDFT